MDGILQMIARQEAWDGFLAYRLRKGRFTWRSFEQADDFVECERYLPLARHLAAGGSLSLPERLVINKMGTGKKRIVYRFQPEEMTVLKLIANLLYRYDGRFASGCYAFRRGVRASDAIFQLRSALKGRRMWAYKVDIHDYFNSIPIPLLLPLLKQWLSDDEPIYGFFERLLDDDRAMCGDTVVRAPRGVMAGTPTAPFLADVYLSEVDHHFCDAGVIYARYSDDIILFSPDSQTLEHHKATLMEFFREYSLSVNPEKEHTYTPDEPFEYLGFRCSRRQIDISMATRQKMKAKIRRKARAMRRWCSREGKDPTLAMKGLIRYFNRKFFDSSDPDRLSWSRWYFPVINRTEGLREIDHYLQEQLRFVASGRHCKANYRVRYADLKTLGYKSLVHEYHLYHKRKTLEYGK